MLLLHWALGRRWRLQNLLLLAASAVFYGWWDARFLSLIGASIVVDYFVAIQLSQAPTKARQRTWLAVSLAFNLGMLIWFKYAGFLVDQWVSSWAAVGVTMDPVTWKIILPVGISFYTFQTLSYSVDVYRKHIPPCRDFVAFATYVSFFPQLVAGPIERATRLLPQMLQERKLNAISVRVGWRLICWGVFKKVVIADSAAMYANAAFGDDAVSGPVMVLGVVAFALQIGSSEFDCGPTSGSLTSHATWENSGDVGTSLSTPGSAIISTSPWVGRAWDVDVHCSMWSWCSWSAAFGMAPIGNS